jgi:hypothetical protein
MFGLKSVQVFSFVLALSGLLLSFEYRSSGLVPVPSDKEMLEAQSPLPQPSPPKPPPKTPMPAPHPGPGPKPPR